MKPPKLCNHTRTRLKLYFYETWNVTTQQPEAERRYCTYCNVRKSFVRYTGGKPWVKVSQSPGPPLKAAVNQPKYPMTETEEAKKGTI